MAAPEVDRHGEALVLGEEALFGVNNSRPICLQRRTGHRCAGDGGELRGRDQSGSQSGDALTGSRVPAPARSNFFGPSTTAFDCSLHLVMFLSGGVTGSIAILPAVEPFLSSPRR